MSTPTPTGRDAVATARRLSNARALATIRRLGSARTAAYAGRLDPAEPGDVLAALITAAWTPNGGAR